MVSYICKVIGRFAFITDGRFLTHRSALFILLVVVVVISCNCNEHKICTNIYIDESTPDIVIVVCCVISYHYECTIFDDRGVNMVHLGVYCNVDMVDGG